MTRTEAQAVALEALEYAAEDYAYRADFEPRLPDTRSERAEYTEAANRFTEAREILMPKLGA